jgi:HSP20 family protein
MSRDPQRCSELFLAAARAFQYPQWQPAVDVFRTPDGWLLKYELAGILPEEIQLTIRGRTVTVRGARRDVRLDEQRQSYTMEISYNQFERSLDLPCDLEAMSVTTDYRDGMLTVRLKCEEPGA